MVNTAFSRLVIDVEILKVVVEVDTTRAKIATQECRVRGEYGGDIDVALPAERYGHADLPFMEMSDHGLGELSRDVLNKCRGQYRVRKRQQA